MKHRIGLTVTDPNHPMVSKRKETIQKTVRVSGEDREKAINSAIAHYKRKGYKVHDHHYIGTVNEEVEQIDEVGDTNKGQKLLRQVNKRAVDRLVSKRADTDPAYAKKAQQTHLAADSRLKEAKDSREYDYEGDMAKSQLRAIIANAQRAHDMLDDNTNMAEWVQSKITLAADYITTVADYMQSEVKEEVAQVDELRTSTMLRYATKANKALIGGDRNKEEKRIKGIQKANYKIQTRHSVKEEAELDEAMDADHPIAKEYKALKQHDIKTLRNMIKGQQKIVDVSGYSSKDHAISAYLRHKHGDKNVAAAMGLKEADAFPVGHAGDAAKASVKSTRQSAETRSRSTAAQAVNKSKTDAAMKEDIEQQDEAWAQGNRNPQRGIKVGHKVRSYDFPGMHDDHYVEGHVVGETPHSYHIRVNRVVRSGKEIPTPAHMSHVEAPKGKGMFSNAYAVHKMIAKQTEVQAAPEPAKGGARTFASVRGKK